MWMNVACLVGRAASEPKKRTTANGTEYVTLRVAVRRSNQHTDFFTVEMWGQLARHALDQVTVGRLLSLRCELRQQEWGSGEDRKEKVSLVVRKLGFLTPRGNASVEADAA